MIESDQGLTEGEVFSLIFRPGFSTAEKVTEVSGRGVGMDVVKKGVESMRGRRIGKIRLELLEDAT